MRASALPCPARLAGSPVLGSRKMPARPAAGLAAASLEYRTVVTGGSWPTCADDVVADVLAYHAHTGLPLSRIVLAGHSAGGAPRAAVRAPAGQPQRVVGMAAVTDLVAADRDGLGGRAVAGLPAAPADCRAGFGSMLAAVPGRRQVHGVAR
jgi:acetyl esterase/lipase